jgi:hypothetical protein
MILTSNALELLNDHQQFKEVSVCSMELLWERVKTIYKSYTGKQIMKNHSRGDLKLKLLTSLRV